MATAPASDHVGGGSGRGARGAPDGHTSGPPDHHTSGPPDHHTSGPPENGSKLSDRTPILGHMPKLVSSPVFVGRSAELALFDDAFRRADAGTASVVLVGGEAGVGKTRLLEEVTGRAAAEDGLVLCGGCVEMGGEGLPLAPVVEALRRLVRQVGVDELDRLVSGRRGELARLLPELADAARPAPGWDNGVSPGIGRLFDLVLALLEGLSELRLVLLVVEDLHWADRSTRDLVGFLARNLSSSRVVLVATYRSDEMHRGHPLRPFLGELERLRSVERRELARFVRGEVAEQIAAILGEPPAAGTVESIYSRTEGNAFFVEELVASARTGCLDGLSPTLRDVLVARVETLPTRTQDLLRVAAAGGRRVGHRLLAAIVEWPDHELWDAVRPAVAGNVLLVDTEVDAYVFRHALVREALHEEALPGEHADLHRRYAEAVESDPGLAGGGARAAAAAAYHWSSAHNLPKALPALVTAARAAAESYAYAEAHQHLERALEIWDQVPDAVATTGLDHLAVLEFAVDTARVAGEWHRALKLALAAREEVTALNDPLRAALVLVAHSALLRNLALADGVAELEEAMRLVPPEPPTEVRAQVLAALGKTLTLVPRAKEARVVTEEALALARQVGNRRAEAQALLVLGCGAGGSAPPDIGMVREARRIARELGDDNMVVTTYVNESDQALSAGRFEEAIDVGRDGMRQAARIGLARNSGTILAGNVDEALFKAGRWDEAAELVTDMFQLGPVGVHAVFIHALRAQMSLAKGRLEDARRDLEEANELLAVRFVGAQYTLPIAAVGAELAIWRGEPDGVAGRALAALRQHDLDDVSRYAAPLLALAMRAAGDAAERARARRDGDALDAALEAAHLLATEAGLTPAHGNTEIEAWTVLLAAELTRADGRPSPAAWSAAVHAWSSEGQPYVQAYVSYRSAEALLAVGDRDAAERTLRCAHETTERLGAVLLGREVEALARRGRLPLGAAEPPAGTPGAQGGVGGGAGSATEPADDASRFGLTPREVEVLRHLTVGRTNPQIASTLFISAKTASTHVSNILAKLGVATRGEAAAIAHHLRLFEPEEVS